MVKLERRKTETITLKDTLAARLVGGRGFGAYYLTKYVQGGIDPYSPRNVLVLASGPLNNTRTPLASKLGFFFKSPLTNAFGESYVGGSIPRFPKAAGYDVVIIVGKAEKPTYLVIGDESVEFRDASDLWGRTTIETDDILKREYGEKSSIACIGPAGENLVRFACICVDKWRQAGRCGGGAVMGSKKLKAIVFIGDEETSVADEEKFRELLDEISSRIAVSKSVRGMRKYGTSSMAALANEMGFFPTMYWSRGRLDGWENIGPEAIREVLIHPHPCWNCPIACGRYVKIRTRWGEVEMDGPEYETIFALGGLFGLNNLEGLLYLNYLADAFGLDTITLGNILGFAVEASKRNSLPMRISYGDVESAIELIKLIVERKGVGAILSEGVAIASRRIGLENLSVHVKGLEPAGYDPRVLKGMSIAYAVSPRGACHLRAMAYIIDIRRLAGEPDIIEEKKVMKIVEFEDWMTSFDSLILCKFGRDIFDFELMHKFYVAVTGLRVGIKEYRASMRRILLLVRFFNEREGLDRSNDSLPQRFFAEPIETEHGKYVLDRKEFNDALDRYYRLRGLTSDGRLIDEDRREIMRMLEE